MSARRNTLLRVATVLVDGTRLALQCGAVFLLAVAAAVTMGRR